MAEGGVFLDIFARLNLASVDRVLRDVKTAMKEGGVSAGRSFSEGMTASFDEIGKQANLAFRDMQRGLAELQRAEAQINDLRVRNFKRTSDAMISAQREVDAAIANTQKLIEASAAADRAGMVAPVGRGTPDRGRGREEVIPMGRGFRMAGVGSALALAGGAYEGVRVGGDTQRNMQQVMAFHQDPTHTPDYIQRQTQGIYQMSTRVPFNPQELSRVYQDIENHGYTGQAALDVLNTSAQAAVATGASLKDTTDGLMTSVKDFGTQAELQSDNLDKYKQGLADLNQMAGQVVATFGSMKGVNPDEFFRSLGTIEPTAMAAFLGPGSKLTGPQASAQVNSALAQLAQIGIGPEQGSHNVSRIISQLGAVVPGSNMYNMLGQLNVPGGPEAIARQTREQGIFGPLQTIQQAINARTDANGMVDIGWRYNNAQVDANIQQDLDQLPPEAQAFVQAHPEIAAGNARPFALKKEAPDAPWLQDVLTLADWYKTKASPNKYTKKGGSTLLTPEQVYQQLFGTGDIARTGIALGENASEGQATADKLTSVGGGALATGFNEMMNTLPNQGKQLGASFAALAGELGQNLLPALTRFVGDLNGVTNWLGQHKAAEEAIVGVLTTIAGAWGVAKVINMFGDIVEAFGPLKTGASALGNLLSNRLPTQVASVGTASEAAAAEIKSSGLGAALKGAAASVASTFNPVALSAMIADLVLNRVKEQVGNSGGGVPKTIIQSLQDNPTTGVGLFHWLTQGKARGGIVGYAGGGKTADPYSQPLMGMPDMGGDSVLGMLPGGMPVGLRGGEGILTPETVEALGGKEGIDRLNKNPWANPMHVATTAYGSFAKGFAKYSPWGKYLEASAHGLEALEKEFEESTGEHEKGRKGLPSEIRQMLASGMSPEQVMQTLGATRGKRGGYELPSGQYLSNTDRALLGLPAAPRSGGGGLVAALRRAGIDPGMYPMLQGFARAEGNNPSGAPTLGFTDSQAGSTLDEHAQALAAQIRARQSVAGPFPAGGTPQEQASWMATVVGQNGVQSDWQGNAQPSRQSYVNSVVSGFGGGHDAWWSKGGVIPHYDGGGILPIPGMQQATLGAVKASNPVPAPMQPRQLPHIDPNAPGTQRPGGNLPITTPAPKPAPASGPKAAGGFPSQLTAPDTKPGTAPMAGGDRNIHENTSRQGGTENESKGFGVGGGLLGMAEQAATMAADAFAPGSGQGAQMAFQLMNRAIGYGGQLAGIMASGLVETFLPNNSKLADPTNNLFGKVALGIAGAHKSPDNMAGTSALQFKPKQDLDQGAMAGKQVLPMVHVSGDIHNHTGDHSETTKAMAKGLFGATMGNMPVGGSG